MAIVKRAIVSVFGLRAELDTLAQSVVTETNRASGIESNIAQDLSAEVQNRTQAVSDLNQVTVKKSANLSDLQDVGIARTNIDVYSKEEVTAAIDAAKLALGTNYTVTDNAARDALVGLDTADTVTVENGGDWVKYGVSSVTAGVASFYPMISKVEWEAANSASAVKAAYESNANTNAYTDAAKTKVDFISITKARNLDKLVQSDELVDLSVARSTTQIASAAAVQSYVTGAVRVGGAILTGETLTVTGGKIVLTNKAKDGIILNFGTVRYIDENSVASDIEVAIDATDVSGKTFTVASDTAGQFDTKQVKVQYMYIAAA